MRVEQRCVSKSPKIYIVIFLQNTIEISITPSQILKFLFKWNSWSHWTKSYLQLRLCMPKILHKGWRKDCRSSPGSLISHFIDRISRDKMQYSGDADENLNICTAYIKKQPSTLNRCLICTSVCTGQHLSHLLVWHHWLKIQLSHPTMQHRFLTHTHRGTTSTSPKRWPLIDKSSQHQLNLQMLERKVGAMVQNLG